MSLYEYGITRNVKAQNEAGDDLLIALVVIMHDNGTRQVVAIPESEIMVQGEEIIETRVIEAAASPGDVQFRKALN